MKADLLLRRFDSSILASLITTDEINLEDGVRLMLPVPQKTGAYVFLGDDKSFLYLIQAHMLLAGSTYLICKGGKDTVKLPDKYEQQINLLYLNLSESEVAQLLSAVQGSEQDDAEAGENVLRAFFRDASLGRVTSTETMLFWAKRFPYPLKTFLCCIVIHAERALPRQQAVHDITKALHGFFPETNLFYLNKEWIVFYTQDHQSSGEPDIDYEKFSTLLQQLGLNAGLSYVGVIPENMYTLYLTARASIILGTKISVPPRIKRIFTFSQYHQLYLIHLCAKEYDRVHNHSNFYYMAHPDIVRIFLHDQECGTDLLDTLYAYLINQSSLTKTAQFLFMHRNTVYNKLLKIEALIGYPLSKVRDHSIFILSYMVVKYYCDYQSNILV